MPRPKNNFLHNYFNIIDESFVVCNNGSCENKNLNNHTGNLERHLKRFHHDLYGDYAKIKCENKNKPSNLKKKIFQVI